jgi:dTDP-4-dehydrorhamnose reductase
MLRVLQFGATGQLGRALIDGGRSANIALTALDRAQADLARPGAAAAATAASPADVVVIAAAYTAVDRAESEEAMAHRINAAAPAEIAQAAAARSVPVIYVSTDYVFAGTGSHAWQEDDATVPLNAYGRTKAAGEAAVLAASPENLVIRTSWVFSPWGRNFVTTMLRLAEGQDEISVARDQRGRPTSALDLANAILAIAPRAISGEITGILHFANAGETDWAEFAQTVFAEAKARNWPHARVRRIPASDYPAPAMRPANSVLDTARFERLTGLIPRPWHEALSETLDRMALDAACSPDA